MDQERKESKQIAHILPINRINTAEYIQQEGWEPNYLNIDNKKIVQLNLIGTVVQLSTESSYWSLLIDDCTGTINIRLYNREELGSEIAVGDTVNIVAKPRGFDAERYLLADLIKKLDNPKWILLRQLELRSIQKEGKKLEAKKQETKGEEKTKEQSTIPDSKTGVLEAIRELDLGKGIAIEEIIKKKGSEAELIIKNLLNQGDIFEISPGIIKVLE
ncbi:MAG: hypothetical protein QF915_02365 [Candidatus Woesearchaeota archaeon]|jgi:RPA family protein|nr:hypothetical protein [Candidatus Woesearchaeota archaeon]MDP7457927.1 hypothetical protein [Candidatus Woesearchaeota archaeon]